MADLSIDMCGIKSPNPFWLASAPPANGGEQVMRAFDAGWGGAVWKTLGNPIVNVSSRFGALDYNGAKVAGFTNIELITDRPLETNFREIAAVKKRYPKHAIIVSLMVESRDEWREIIKRAEDTGADGLELNFGCPHGMCERGMGSSVGQEPEVLAEITRWAKEFAKTPVLVKLTPNIGDIVEPGLAAVAGGADGLSLINTIKSIIGVDLDRMVPLPRVGGYSTNGGYCGPAVKPIALHMVGALARDPRIAIPMSGIGGISTWRDAAEFIALGCTSVQVCTAVMHHGYRIVEDMIDGLSAFLDSRGMKSVNELRGLAVGQYREWGELDMNHAVVARIDPSKCIGCQLCYTACLDGAHQCIHVAEGPCRAWHGEPDHGKHPRLEPNPVHVHAHDKSGDKHVRVPIVDEKECIGCNLCALVCPVEGCIEMVQVPTDQPFESWNERVARGAGKVPGGLFELPGPPMHDADLAEEALRELPPDIAGSPLFSGDLAPVPPARRNWSTYNFAALWISMAHCIPTYMMAGGLVAVGMNWWQALLTIGLGNVIVLVPILLNAHPGTAYGIPFPVLARASFGTAGANVPAVLRAIVACGWFGIQSFIGGEAIKTFVEALWPAFGHLGGDARLLGLSVPSALTFLLFWGLNIWIIYRGMNAVRVFENWAAPLVLVMALALLVWAVGKAGGVGPMLTQPSKFKTAGEFWKVFIPSLTGMIGFWATLSLNIPDFTRFGRGQREQMLGQTLGLPTTMIAFSAMGVVITSASQAILRGVDASKLWDPVFILAQLTSPTPPAGLDAPLLASPALRGLVAVVSLFGVGVATLSVNIAANVVSPANDFANLAPRHISFKTGGLITGLLGIAMMPWKLLASADTYIFNWLVGYSALLGPIAGIMIADYWVLRRTKLDVPDLYRPHGQYAGVNTVAVVALVLGVLPNVPGFLKSAHVIEGPENFFDAIYVYAWFTGVLISGALYLVGMKLKGTGASAPTTA